MERDGQYVSQPFVCRVSEDNVASRNLDILQMPHLFLKLWSLLVSV